MNYTVTNNIQDCQLASLQGHLYGVTYNQLVEAFGEPIKVQDDYKTQVQWIIKFEDGQVATIYDWKIASRVQDNLEWNVGGHYYTVHTLVQDALA